MCDGSNDPSDNLWNTMYWFEVVEATRFFGRAQLTKRLGFPV